MTETQPKSWLNQNIKPMLATIVVVTSISYFYMCSIRNIKPDPQIVIAMVSIVSMVLGYYFGSSTKTENMPVAKTDSGDITVK